MGFVALALLAKLDNRPWMRSNFVSSLVGARLGFSLVFFASADAVVPAR